ncbi:hypothetical protein Q7P36_007938 [Cladosporium allicinum]
MSPQDPSATDRAARRNSFGRALDRFKNAFSRRASSNKTTSPPDLTGDATAGAANPTTTTTAEDAAPTPPLSRPVFSHENALEVDENVIDDFDDTEEPIIPVDASTGRPGLSEERARLLFEHYGLKYPTLKRSQQEPSSKIRRVEKPVRIRLHWSCHHCNTAFGRDKVCNSCGHGRCGECARAPAQRVLRILEKSRREKDAAEIKERAAVASPEDDVVLGPSSTMLAQQVPIDLQTENATAPSPQDEESEGEREPLRFVYTIRSGALGGTGGLELYHMTPQRPYGRDTPKPSVQRVYKQPRQRVRWTCDMCDSIFISRDRCDNCQHEKCGDCIRSPSKKDKPSVDPSVLRSVEARLAGGPSTEYQPQLVAAV